MKRIAIALGVAMGLFVAYVLAHWALIEIGREVIVLRTEDPDGEWRETRLWLVDEGGFPYLHGSTSDWMRNLRERPIVEVERAGVAHRYRAVVVPGPHPVIDQRLREKYGFADRWVRFVMPDDENAAPVRLEILDAPRVRELP